MIDPFAWIDWLIGTWLHWLVDVLEARPHDRVGRHKARR